MDSGHSADRFQFQGFFSLNRVHGHVFRRVYSRKRDESHSDEKEQQRKEVVDAQENGVVDVSIDEESNQ